MPTLGEPESGDHMTKLHCDQCGASERGERAVGWFEVKYAPSLEALDMHEALTLHFCAWTCLAQYAREEAA